MSIPSSTASSKSEPIPASGHLPTFLIIGVQKAGTTSIYNYLGQHPQVFLSPLKETNFFSKDWAALPPEVLAKRKNKVITIDDYRALFDKVSDEIAIGEASPNYLLYHNGAVRRIQQYVPAAKLIAILRNPVQRAYSDYLMHVRDAIGTRNKSLEEQLQTSPHKSHMLLKGKYYEGIKHFIDVFGSEQIQVMLYDDLRQDAVTFMQSIYRFIGVNDRFEPDTQKRMQTAQVPKNQTFNRLMRSNNPVRESVSRILRLVLPEQARRGFRDRLIALNSTSKPQSGLSEGTRQQLQAYYRDDILQLQDLLQRDLSTWLA